jgi:hypothetical protein
MSEFLSIPREVRDMILDDIVIVPRPPAPPVAEILKIERNDVSGNDPRIKEFHIHYPISPLTNPGLPLLAVNQQLNAETNATQSRNSSQAYHLDVIVLGNGDHIYPTWLSIPKSTRSIENLVITIRPFEISSAISFANYETPQSYETETNDVRSSPFRALFFLLLDLLRHGPVFRSSQSRRDVHINWLEIEVIGYKPELNKASSTSSVDMQQYIYAHSLQLFTESLVNSLHLLLGSRHLFHRMTPPVRPLESVYLDYFTTRLYDPDPNFRDMRREIRGGLQYLRLVCGGRKLGAWQYGEDAQLPTEDMTEQERKRAEDKLREFRRLRNFVAL